MALRTTVTERRHAGFTLVEALMTLALACVVLAALMALYLYSNRAFVSLTQHVIMEQQNQHAMDLLSRQIRGAKGLTACSSNTLTLTDQNGETVNLVYDPGRRLLSSIRNGRTNALL